MGAARRNAGRSGSEGFTLMEVVLAMLVLGIGVAAAFGLLSSLIRMDQYSNRLVVATTAAQSAIEDLRSRPYTNIVDGSASTGIFSLAWTVASDFSITAKTIQVTASWTEPSGGSRNTSLKTIVRKP